MEFYLVWALLIVVCILEAISSEVYPHDFKNYEENNNNKKRSKDTI